MTELFELRQYTLHPGRRDELVALFDREFVESQAEVGMRVYGQFRDLDDPDRFVWIRGFPDASRRAESLAAFYERHPAWLKHREAANATMADSDDVLLLTLVSGDLGAAGGSPPVSVSGGLGVVGVSRPVPVGGDLGAAGNSPPGPVTGGPAVAGGSPPGPVSGGSGVAGGSPPGPVSGGSGVAGGSPPGPVSGGSGVAGGSPPGPVSGGSGVARGSSAAGAGGGGAAPFEIVICHPEDPDAFPEFFRRELLPALSEAGASPLATFRTSVQRNDYPRLPVREGEQVFVWLSRSPVPAELLPAGRRPPQRLRLAPTPRSWLR
ncbi:putative quinol monooxygenase [Amycolatopsis sp. ATCC 39116]|uniref:putative quinol monooxygenase n=1 Tax=Amycolatopsis sp. (strain ATCC 39116 / 75iv2) TaxID=385957 RepID=UPI0003773FC8|nr:NIPSNAP family protein [Amycolatopsis sp. ATCC 39116]